MPKLRTCEIPDKPKELYIKLYCERVGISTKAIRKKAAQSWISLSHPKKKHFLRTCIQKQYVDTAQRIQSTEPFLKPLEGVKFNENDIETNNKGCMDTEMNDSHHDKEDNLENNAAECATTQVLNDSHHDKEDNLENNAAECATTQVLNDNHHDKEDNLENNAAECATTQHTAAIEEDNTIVPNFNEETPDNTILENSTNDVQQNLRDLTDPDNETNNVKATKPDNIQEPIPPSFKNTRELFNMLNKDKNKTYKDITKIERYAYTYIMRKIRTEYIEKYMQYLESLSLKELHAHYLRES